MADVKMAQKINPLLVSLCIFFVFFPMLPKRFPFGSPVALMFCFNVKFKFPVPKPGFWSFSAATQLLVCRVAYAFFLAPSSPAEYIYRSGRTVSDSGRECSLLSMWKSLAFLSTPVSVSSHLYTSD